MHLIDVGEVSDGIISDASDSRARGGKLYQRTKTGPWRAGKARNMEMSDALSETGRHQSQGSAKRGKRCRGRFPFLLQKRLRFVLQFPTMKAKKVDSLSSSSSGDTLRRASKLHSARFTPRRTASPRPFSSSSSCLPPAAICSSSCLIRPWKTLKARQVKREIGSRSSAEESERWLQLPFACRIPHFAGEIALKPGEGGPFCQR